MKYISLDIETADPLLLTHGPSWVFGQGKILCVGLYDVEKQKKKCIDGDGGKAVKDILLSAKHTVIGANIQYDLGWLTSAHGISVKDMQCGLIDVQVAESMIDEYQPFRLGDLAQKYLNEQKGSGNLPSICIALSLKGDFRKHLGTLWDINSEPIREEIRQYVMSDADQPARIWAQQKAIMSIQGLLPAFEMNMRMLKACMKMKQSGVRINYEQWLENCAMAQKIHDKLETTFFAKWGEVNINSPKQLGEFFDRHNVDYKKRITVRGWEPEGRKFTKATDQFRGTQVTDQRKRLKADFSGIKIEKDLLRLYVDKQYAARTVAQFERLGYNVTCTPNVDKYFMKDNKGTYPAVADLVEYKTVKGLISKFFGEKFGRFLVYHKDKKEWRLHGNFNVVGARQTSRLSSQNPNLQNLPAKTLLFEGTEHEVDMAVMCREVFLPEKGHIWVKLDFSGQENRLQAHFAVGPSAKRIQKMYCENPRFDEHQFVATSSGLEAEHGKKVGRKYAKNVRFGLSYGMQLARMMTQFGWEKDFAEELSEAVKDASPWFVDTMEAVQKKVAKTGHIKTLLGRRIHLRQGAEDKTYPFYNYLIQGSAADQTKATNAAISESETVERQTLTVHDEWDGSLPMTKEGLARLKELQHLMETLLILDVPMICDPEIGSDWAHIEGQKQDDNGYPTETIDELWARVTKQVKAGNPVKVREFDLSVLDEEEDEEEADDDN